MLNFTRSTGNGIGIRLYPEDLVSTSLTARIQSLLKSLGISENQVNLIVDIGITGELGLDVGQICTIVPTIDKWRTFTVISGAFPKDLSELEKNKQHMLDRLDWQAWSSQISVVSKRNRMPSFGDYTVQYPYLIEPPTIFNQSASIRYTSENYWVIMRGEGVRNDDGPGYAGYLGNAQLLICRTEFCGEKFSAGDRYIAEMSRQNTKPGNPETWIRAAINHHLTYVAHQVAGLP